MKTLGNLGFAPIYKQLTAVDKCLKASYTERNRNPKT